MTRRSRKARSGGPLPSLATLTRVHRGDAKRVPELVDTERAFAESALLGARLFGPDVTIAAASRWIEILSLVLREGVISQDAIYRALQRWSRATISRDLDDLYTRGFVFEPEFEGESHRVRWIAMDLSGRHRFYVANEKTQALADPLGELRELRRRCHAPADRPRGACRAAKPQVVTLYGPGPIIRKRRGARPRWLRKRPSWLAA